jgi:hypothetical protein
MFSEILGHAYRRPTSDAGCGSVVRLARPQCNDPIRCVLTNSRVTI